MGKFLLLFLCFKVHADLVLKVGQIHPLPVTSSVLVGSKKIVEVKNGQLIAKKTGETTLSSRQSFQKISVLTKEDWQLWSLLKTKKELHLKDGKLYWKGVSNVENLIYMEKLLAKTQGQLFDCAEKRPGPDRTKMAPQAFGLCSFFFSIFVGTLFANSSK